MTENPQKEDGYTAIAHEIVEALSRINLSPYESRFLWCLFRKTYGWNKKSDWVSLSQITEITGMRKAHISRSKKKLLLRKIVTQTGNKISFNKYHSQWCELPKQVTVTQTGNAVTQTGNKKLPKQGHTIQNTKLLIQNNTREEILKHLKTLDSIGNPEAYLASLEAKVSFMSISKAWKEWKRGRGVDNVNDFYQRCITLENE